MPDFVAAIAPDMGDGVDRHQVRQVRHGHAGLQAQESKRIGVTGEDLFGDVVCA